MIIILNDKSGIVNFDSLTCFGVKKNTLVGVTNSEALPLATYDTKERAKEVMSEIIDTIMKRRVDVIPLPEK